MKKFNLKEFLVKNKTKFMIGALALTTSAAVVMRIGIAQHNEFLKEHELYDEFYAVLEE